ncbi:MAG: aldo/keto reductase [Anaerolineae bacterium]|nr:aldo/keto reductase [Anaerolineae bacterium]
MQSTTITLGKTDIRIPELGTGAWQWGDRLMWDYGKGGYTDADIHAVFNAAMAAGISFFDTAEVYGMGRSETLLGQFIHESQQEVTVATKFMPFPWRLHRSRLIAALKRSLKRLGLPRVDLYQVHFPLPPLPVEQWAAGLADAVEAGLTRAVGVSNFSAAQMGRTFNTLAARGVPLASNQIEYSLLHREPERNGQMQTAHDLGITIIAYSPLAKGILTGKYTPENPPPGARRRIYNQERLQKVQPLIALMREIGEAHGGKSPAQVALNWTICKGAVPIPGAKNVRQLESNIGAAGWRLTEDEIAALDALSAPLS